MSETATLTAPQPTVGAVEDRPCCADGCIRRAAYAIRFHDQAGHVHDCSPCTAYLREWADVAEVVPLPCPFPHGDDTWTDTPRDLM